MKVEITDATRISEFLRRWKCLMVNYSTEQLLSHERKIEKVSDFLELHGGGQEDFRPSDIPDVPSFTPITTAGLFLAVYLPDKGCVKGFRRTFDGWWDFIVPPTGGTKSRSSELKSDVQHLKLAPGVKYTPGIRWVILNPHTYPGKSPKDALLAQSTIDDDGTTLAHAEVLMATAQLPGWVSSGNGGKSLYLYMSALQCDWGTDGWSGVPASYTRGPGSQMSLLTSWSTSASSDRSSPTVRECSNLGSSVSGRTLDFDH